MAKEVQTTLDSRKLLEKSEISLSLDSYDDIFSDFDPRPFSQRALSDDFLTESKKASRDKLSGIELNFLIPKNKRSSSDENIIRKRLKEHFKKHFNMELSERRHIKNFGLKLIASGIVLMFLATYIMFYFKQPSLLVSFMIILLEPAGWFTFWEGMSRFLFEPAKHKEDLEFYRKMSNCEINFFSY